MKCAVVYYSVTRNNRCLAERIADELGCEAFEIRTSVKSMPLLILLSVIRISPGIRRPPFEIGDCDCLVMCGPIWMGMLIAPLRAFVRKYNKRIKRLCFATCCGSGDGMRYGSFGYEKVFSQLRALLKDKLALCTAFPVELACPGGVLPDKDAAIKTRITDEDFNGEMSKRLDAFVRAVEVMKP